MMLVGLLPFVWLLVKIANDQLGANPIQTMHFYLGKWTLRFLCLSLTISPLIKITQWRWPSGYRRMFGLFTFFYATLHVLNYLIIDHALVWKTIWPDIIESPYILMGLLAFLILLPMAITSNLFWQKKLGRYWKKLHRFVYMAAIAAVTHYFWQLKGNLAEPLFYAAIIGLLLISRFILWLRSPLSRF